MDDDIEKFAKRIQTKYIGFEPMLLIGVIALLIMYYYVFSSLVNFRGFLEDLIAYLIVFNHPLLHFPAQVPFLIERRTILAPPKECIKAIYNI